MLPAMRDERGDWNARGAPLRLRMSPNPEMDNGGQKEEQFEEEHVTQVQQAAVRQGRDAPTQAGDAPKREGWSWRQGEEPQAGDRDRPFGGAEEGGEGAAEEEFEEEEVQLNLSRSP